MTTPRRTTTRRRRTASPIPWQEVGQAAVLLLAIALVWYLAWGQYRHQPAPGVQYRFVKTERGQGQP